MTDNPTAPTGHPSRAQTVAVERCSWSDLLPAECAHCQGSTSPVLAIGVVERAVGRPLPQYRFRAREWRVPDPQPTRCDHRQDDLCGPCSKLLDGLLADVPELVAQLVTTLRKGGRFASHGFRKGDVEHPDEAPLPWSPAAATALAELRLVVQAGSDRRVLLERLSRVSWRARRVIDRPVERALTMCPTCRTEIPVPDDDPECRSIICPVEGCSYAATWQQHLSDLLDANGDAMLTASEIRFVLGRNGEPITRQRISYLVERHGLAREWIVVPSWRGKRLVTDSQWAYRLRDVRDLQARLAG